MIKNFSVVTNFGCKNSCGFCAFRQHRLRNMRTAIDYNNLEWCISKAEGKVSISGGGDPLFDFINNYYTLQRIADICIEQGVLLDLHTNEIILDKLPSLRKLKLNQVVLSAQLPDSTKHSEAVALSEFCKVRIAMVYTGQSVDEINEWIYFYSDFPKLTIREDCYSDSSNRMLFRVLDNTVGYDRTNANVMFLEDGDYNYYFMPDNVVYDDYAATKPSRKFKRW